MFKVDEEKCVGCGVCVEVCPAQAISMDEGKAVISNQCVDCGRCVQACGEREQFGRGTRRGRICRPAATSCTRPT